MRKKLEKLAVGLVAGVCIAGPGYTEAGKPPPGPATYYVDWTNADDSKEDGSARHPFDTITEGIAAAADGDTVLVKDGTYAERISLGKAITVISENGAEFPDGTPRTTIDGQGGGTVVTFISSPAAQAVIEGFTITGGAGVDGGGVLVDDTTATIASCVIEVNSATGSGGGIAVTSGTAYVDNSTITANSAGGYGGGISVDLGSLYASSSTISDNTSAGGGGVDVRSSYAGIDGCTISGNLTAPLFGSGGGLHVWGTSDVNISNSIISDNDGREGGGLQSYGSTVSISANTFITGNHATSKGGGMYFTYGALTITDSFIDDNTAVGNGNVAGAGMHLYGADVHPYTILRTSVSRNQATGAGAGGGILVQGNGASSPDFTITNSQINGNHASVGGGISFGGASGTITNCTLKDNTTVLGGGAVHGRMNGAVQYSSPAVVNSILYGNTTSQIYLEGDSTIAVDCSAVQGDWPHGVCDNIDADCAPAPDYHLVAGSQCIDTASDDTATFPTIPFVDIDGDSRPQGDGFDIGADEFTGTTCGIVITVADYDYVNDELQVQASSPYGDTAGLTLDGYGPMQWNATGGYWLSVEPEAVPPAIISVTGDPGKDNCTATVQ